MNVNNLIQEVKNKLTTKQKVELFKELYAEISSKGVKGDTELAHINTFESRILRMLGGSGTINLETGLKQYLAVEEAVAEEVLLQILLTYKLLEKLQVLKNVN
jgi:hypothetical protein